MRGPLRDVVLCHCVECRRWSGTAGAFAATHDDAPRRRTDDALRWIDSPECDRARAARLLRGVRLEPVLEGGGLRADGIAAGTLDDPTGLRSTAHIYTAQAADWDELPDDGLAREPDASHVPIRWS